MLDIRTFPLLLNDFLLLFVMILLHFLYNYSFYSYIITNLSELEPNINYSVLQHVTNGLEEGGHLTFSSSSYIKVTKINLFDGECENSYI